MSLVKFVKLSSTISLSTRSASSFSSCSSKTLMTRMLDFLLQSHRFLRFYFLFCFVLVFFLYIFLVYVISIIYSSRSTIFFSVPSIMLLAHQANVAFFSSIIYMWFFFTSSISLLRLSMSLLRCLIH